jgi:hypothetical protein
MTSLTKDLVAPKTVKEFTKEWARRILVDYNHYVLDHWLLGSVLGGSNLSGSWLDWDDLWSHVLVLQKSLALHALFDAVEEASLLQSEENSSPDGTENDDGSPELFGLHLGLFLRHIWKRV